MRVPYCAASAVISGNGTHWPRAETSRPKILSRCVFVSIRSEKNISRARLKNRACLSRGARSLAYSFSLSESQLCCLFPQLFLTVDRLHFRFHWPNFLRFGQRSARRRRNPFGSGHCPTLQ